MISIDLKIVRVQFGDFRGEALIKLRKVFLRKVSKSSRGRGVIQISYANHRLEVQSVFYIMAGVETCFLKLSEVIY